MSSVELIREAEEKGHALVALADGDVHICNPENHKFPDTICTHPGCTTVYDSKRHEWCNGSSDSRRRIETRDNWKNGLCLAHCS